MRAHRVRYSNVQVRHPIVKERQEAHLGYCIGVVVDRPGSYHKTTRVAGTLICDVVEEQQTDSKCQSRVISLGTVRYGTVRHSTVNNVTSKVKGALQRFPDMYGPVLLAESISAKADECQ